MQRQIRFAMIIIANMLLFPVANAQELKTHKVLLLLDDCNTPISAGRLSR